MRVVKAIGILCIGFFVSFLVFPVLEMVKPTYRPTTLVISDNISLGDTTQYAISGNYWGLQKFTASSTYYVYQIKLKLWLEGAGTGSFQVRLYNVDTNDEPSGASLCEGTLASSEFTAASPGDWETFALNLHAELLSGHEYVIVGDYTQETAEWVNWRIDGSNTGDFAYSEDAGDTWTHGSIP